MRPGQAARLVRACDAADAAQVHERGFAWVRGRLLPAIQILTERQDKLGARGLNVLATMAELNEGYGESLRLLHESLQCDPEYVLSWFDVGFVNQEIGRLDEARAAYDRVLVLDPRHEKAAVMLAALDENALAAPLALQPAADALARFDPEDALAVLAQPVSSQDHIWRACALGAMENAGRALDEWRAVAARDDAVRISPAAWFYLADDLFDDAHFWDVLVRVSPRFTRSSGAAHPSLVAAVRADGREGDDLEDLDNRVLALMARYHRARLRGDEDEMRDLAAEYPGWIEPAEYQAC